MKFSIFTTRLVREDVPESFAPFQGRTVRGPNNVADMMRALTADAPQEEFWVFVLNTRHNVVGATMVTRGILDATLIHPREIFRAAIVANGAAIVVAHNHPSGDPTPSNEDRAVTRQLDAAGKTLGIPLLDSLVVTADGAFRSCVEGR